jgi:hypothetical protein
MVLIAESSSTKCDWVVLDSLNEEQKKIKTKGLNPFVLENKELQKIISKS